MIVNATVPVEPTLWMDPVTKRLVSAAFMRSDKAHGDYQLAYSVPCVMKHGKPVPIAAAPQPEATQEGLEAVELGELTPQRIEDIAGAVAAAWPKSMEVCARRCRMAAAALRELAKRNPQPVDLGQFREAVNHARMRADSIEQYGRFDALLALIDRQPGDDLLVAAYDAGFARSGEGWNAEIWPDVSGRGSQYANDRAEDIAALRGGQPS